jgi:hypothetical protein|tara:strand:- start:1098 stop:1259 length:162 start_codon:yes stop_codon:yes gene_type:complete
LENKSESKILLILNKDEYIIIMNALRNRNTLQAGKILKDISKLKKREVNLNRP